MSEVLRDLRQRTYKAYMTLDVMAAVASDEAEEARLTAKANGVNLALSYIDEALRMSKEVE